MKAILILGVLAVLSMQTTAADPLGNLFPSKDAVVARGVGFKVNRGELDAALRIYRMNAAAEGNVILPDEKQLERNLLDDLVITRILGQRATNPDKNAAYTEARAEYLKERDKYTSEIAFKIRVGAMGITTNVFRERLYNATLAKVVFRRDVTDKIVVADSQAQAYYNQNKVRWTVPEHAKTANILFSTVNPLTGVKLSKAETVRKHQLARDVRARALAGQNFSRLVQDWSEDPVTRDHGGEMTIQRGMLAKEVEQLVFGMQPGQISGVLETPLGYNIIRLIEKKPTTIQPFETIKAEIKKSIADAEARKKLPGYYAQLRAAAKVEILLGK